MIKSEIVYYSIDYKDVVKRTLCSSKEWRASPPQNLYVVKFNKKTKNKYIETYILTKIDNGEYAYCLDGAPSATKVFHLVIGHAKFAVEIALTEKPDSNRWRQIKEREQQYLSLKKQEMAKSDKKAATPPQAKATAQKVRAAKVAKNKYKLTAADRKKGQENRALITELARNLALQDNANAKTVTKTIKVRTVEATKGKLKKSMAAYRKDAECTIKGTCKPSKK